MESEAGGFGGLLLPQVALDEDILALLPSSAQALEGGATLDAKVGKALVEVPDRDLGGCLGRPRLGQSGGLGDMRSKDAGGVLGPLLRQVAVARARSMLARRTIATATWRRSGPRTPPASLLRMSPRPPDCPRRGRPGQPPRSRPGAATSALPTLASSVAPPSRA